MIPHRRADRGWFFPEIVLGCVFMSWAMVQMWPSPDPELSEMSPQWQAWATLLMLVGSVLCVIGVVTGTLMRLRESVLALVYLVGLLMLGFGVGSYAVAAVVNASSVWIPLSGLAVFIVSGAVRALSDIVIMWVHRRRGDEGTSAWRTTQN